MNKKEMEFFKQNLETRKNFIVENLNINSKEIEALLNSAPSDSVDFSTIETSSQLDLAISANLKKELQDINFALDKIKNNNYGTCELCDESIDPDRLKIKPDAKYCIICHESIEKGAIK